MQIRKGTKRDIKEVAALYDALHGYLEENINYPGWQKGIYPIGEDAVLAVEEETLFVACEDGQIAGTVILNQRQEQGYETIDWKVGLDSPEVLVVHTLVVHPRFRSRGIGKGIMGFSLDYAKARGMKAVRLDVYEKNVPAIGLYERMGFRYMGMADLGYRQYGLDNFRLYQYLVEEGRPGRGGNRERKCAQENDAG